MVCRLLHSKIVIIEYVTFSLIFRLLPEYYFPYTFLQDGNAARALPFGSG